MDSLLVSDPKGLGFPHRPAIQFNNNTQTNINILIIENTLMENQSKSDPVSVSFDELYKSLTVTAREIIDKLNNLLAQEVPDGIQSLKPSEVTPEATAEKIVSGATAFFHVFAEQNPNLEKEELLDKFMETIRGGIDQGYNEAFSILEGLGAFEFEGVQSGIEETKQLIEEKLVAYEAHMRKVLGIDPVEVESEVSTSTQNQILTQAGAQTLNVAA